MEDGQSYGDVPLNTTDVSSTATSRSAAASSSSSSSSLAPSTSTTATTATRTTGGVTDPAWVRRLFRSRGGLVSFSLVAACMVLAAMVAATSGVASLDGGKETVCVIPAKTAATDDFGYNDAAQDEAWPVAVRRKNENYMKQANVNRTLWTRDLLDTQIERWSVCWETPQNTELTLQCDRGGTFESISFASYGLPQGTCGNYMTSWCHSERSMSVVSSACVSQQECTIYASDSIFGRPCGGEKHLAVQAECSRTVYNEDVVEFRVKLHARPTMFGFAMLDFLCVIAGGLLLLYGLGDSRKLPCVLYHLSQWISSICLLFVFLLAISNISWLNGFYTGINNSHVLCHPHVSSTASILASILSVLFIIFNMICSIFVSPFTSEIHGTSLSDYVQMFLQKISNCLRFGFRGFFYTVGYLRSQTRTPPALFVRIQGDTFYKEIAFMEGTSFQSYEQFLEVVSKRVKCSSSKVSYLVKNDNIIINEHDDLACLTAGDHLEVVMKREEDA
ncbi:hypothetical protein Pelo_10052 [Pelomyxa schiedti]|nr:hypothetical protein Pelo_10052 [Pelomyxa schiedti]